MGTEAGAAMGYHGVLAAKLAAIAGVLAGLRNLKCARQAGCRAKIFSSTKKQGSSKCCEGVPCQWQRLRVRSEHALRLTRAAVGQSVLVKVGTASQL